MGEGRMSGKNTLLLTSLITLIITGCVSRELPRQTGEPWRDVANLLPVELDGQRRTDAFPGTGPFFLDFDGEQIGKVTPFNPTPPERYAGWIYNVMYGDYIILFGIDPTRIEKTIEEMALYDYYTEYELNGFSVYYGIDEEDCPGVMGVHGNFFIATSVNPGDVDPTQFFNRLIEAIDTSKLPE